jgi:O-antigen/teichoic acid export membrane protein
MFKKKLNNIFQNMIFKNFSILLIGNGIISLIGLINVFLSTKTIGLSGIGTIAIVQTYVLIITQLFNFQSFHSVIKYVVKNLEQKNIFKAKKYIKMGFVFDLYSALLAMSLGFLLLHIVSVFFDWNIEIKFYIKLYLLTMLFNIMGTPTALIRIFNRYEYITYTNVIIAISKLIIYTFGFLNNQPILFFLVTEGLLAILGNLIVFIFGLNILKNNKLSGFYKEKIRFPLEFIKFNIYNNLATITELPVTQLTNFIINKYLGLEELGIFNILQKIGGVFLRLTNPIAQVIYPELSRLISKNKIKQGIILAFNIFKYVSYAGIVTILVIIVIGRSGILSNYFEDSNKYFWLLIFYIIYLTFYSGVTGINQLIIATGRVSINFYISLSTNLLYLLMLLMVINRFGLIGLVFTLFIQVFIASLLRIFVIKNERSSFLIERKII